MTSLKILLTTLFVTALLIAAQSTPVFAQGSGPSFTPDDLFMGQSDLIEKPDGVKEIDAKAQAETGAEIGILWFISTLMKVATTVAGVWILFIISTTAFSLINGKGKADNYSKLATATTQSFIGIMLIIGSYAIVGLISLVMYGDASYILNPVL